MDQNFIQQPAQSDFKINAKPSKNPNLLPKILLFSGIFFILVAAGLIIYSFLAPKSASEVAFDAKNSEKSAQIYDVLTGEEISDASLNSSPVYCVQTPNGTDGARPQAGLNEAKVVFEAIAEAGITRFAAIYQNPTSAVIGPIRSLRLYYLEWDTPFDCTIVHAGGAADALAAVSSGDYKDLTENYSYMYRGNYANYDRLWNNLFTTSTYLNQVVSDRGTTTSNPTGFTRLTPENSKKSRIDASVSEKLEITTPTTQNLDVLTPEPTHISLNFGTWATFNVRYTYNSATNTYNRSYETGAAHEVYACPSGNLGEVTPESSCNLVQLSPSVVIAMIVQEEKASDNYHEDITTVGSGKVYIFQNGAVISGTWEKSSISEQIHFYDESGAEIALAPGQTWISAIPTYGSVEYQ